MLRFEMVLRVHLQFSEDMIATMIEGLYVYLTQKLPIKNVHFA